MNLNLLSISGVVLGFICSILTFILIIYGKNEIHRLWALYNFFVVVWGFGLFKIGTAQDAEHAMIFWKVANTGGIFIPATFLHIVYLFCQKKRMGIVVLSYVLVLIFSFLDTFNLLNYQMKYIFNSLYYIKPMGPQYPIVCIVWLLIAVCGFYELFKFYRHAQGSKRNQILYFFVGWLFGLTGGATHFLPIFGFNIYPFGQMGIAIYGMMSTYAVLRYRLMDIKVAITRAGLFILVYTLVLGLPFVAAISFKNQLIQLFGASWWMSPLILMAVLATGGPFIYIYVQRKAEERLLKEQRRYQSTLKQASVGMTRIRDLRRLLDLIAHIVTKTVRISYAGIYLYNEQAGAYVIQVSRDKGRTPIPKLTADNPLITWIALKRDPLIYEEVKRHMEDTNDASYKLLEENMRLLTASVIIPSFLEDKFIGFFVLGDKLSGQIYTPEDLNVFQVLASQAALAIENAQFYEEAKEMHEQIAQAEKMATVGTMADGLSHQINNRFFALSLIAGDTIDTIKMADTSKCTPEIKEMINQINYALGRIQANVIQGGEVVKGILKYTRKGEEGFEALTLDQILDGTLEMVQFKVRLSDIDIVRDYPKTTPKIKGNLVQLQEAFFNFIDNAYDATVERRTLLKEPGYRGRITVSARHKDGNLEITIEDNGMGIKEESAKKIFTPFFTTKVSSRKGTGLGLYVIRRIITDIHKGKISFESDYKFGTRFFIELPIAT